MSQSTNPVLTRVLSDDALAHARQGSMTLAGVITKAAGMMVLVGAGAAWAYPKVTAEGLEGLGLAFLGALVLSLGLGITVAFRPQVARWAAPFYAVAQGVLLGGVSGALNVKYPGIAAQAVGLTLAVFAVMLGGYRSGLLRLGERGRSIVLGATMGVAGFYLVALVLGFFGLNVPFLVEGGPIGIGFSLLVTGLAAFNLVLDFELIEQGVGVGDETMEWAAAFGLVVTLLWLYIEMLRLLSKLNRR